MGAAVSVIMSCIHMKRIEKDCIASLNQKLCKRYVDNTITKINKNAAMDDFFFFREHELPS